MIAVNRKMATVGANGGCAQKVQLWAFGWALLLQRADLNGRSGGGRISALCGDPHKAENRESIIRQVSK